MQKTAFHATNRKHAVIRPARMKNVYLLSTRKAAQEYAKEFGLQLVLKVKYDTKDVESRWKPAYANGATVIKLKPGKTTA